MINNNFSTQRPNVLGVYRVTLSFLVCYARKPSRHLTLRLLMSYIYGAPSKARNANVVYIWTYVWQR